MKTDNGSFVFPGDGATKRLIDQWQCYLDLWPFRFRTAVTSTLVIVLVQRALTTLTVDPHSYMQHQATTLPIPELQVRLTKPLTRRFSNFDI